jgi:hypothetical protein
MDDSNAGHAANAPGGAPRDGGSADVTEAVPAWLLFNAHGFGDTYLTSALARQFRRLHCRDGQRLVVVVRETHLPIAQLFADSADAIHTVPNRVLDRMRALQARIGGAPRFRPNRALLAHPRGLAGAPIEQLGLIDGVSRLHLLAVGLRLGVPSEPDLPVIPSAWRAAAQREATRRGIVPGRSALLVPNAARWPALGDGFWQRLAERLRASGWTAAVLEDDLPIELLLPLAEQAGWLIGGIDDRMNIAVSAQLGCKKTFVAWAPAQGARFNIDGIALAHPYPYALQRGFDGRDYDVEYIEARADQFDAAIDQIARGRNANFAHQSSVQPVSRLRIDVTPGEVIDKMTILEVKLERLPEDKRLTILGELAALQQAIVAAYGPLSGELKEAADRLRDLNRYAFDANEVIYRDMADPPFELHAPNPDITGRERRVIATITNMLDGVASNRDRVLVKNRINTLLNCDWMERRSFTDRSP